MASNIYPPIPAQDDANCTRFKAVDPQTYKYVGSYFLPRFIAKEFRLGFLYNIPIIAFEMTASVLMDRMRSKIPVPSAESLITVNWKSKLWVS